MRASWSRRGRLSIKRQIMTTGLVLAVTWLLWSGIYEPLFLALGALSCVMVVVLARRTGFFDQEVYSLGLGPRWPSYWAWLLKEIVKTNFQVARIILRRDLAVSPTIVTVDASDLTPVCQATLANAITLTPGTLTLDIEDGVIEVHCLTAEVAGELGDGEMLRRARALQGA